jgi:hypothetical protein
MTAPASLRRVPLRLLLAAALACGVLTAVLGKDDAHADDHGAANRAMTAAQLVLHDQMRKLWEDHVTWTRLAIVEFAADDPGFAATADRLFANQVDIGNAVEPLFRQRRRRPAGVPAARSHRDRGRGDASGQGR